MKLLLLSDSHGDSATMLAIASAESPNAILHMGDGVGAFERMRGAVAPRGIPCYNVKGNCDVLSPAPLFFTLELSGARIFMTHGHMIGVKSGDLSALIAAASAQNATLALYGHTHTQYQQRKSGVLCVNPGAAYMGRYAIAQIDGNGEFSVELLKY